MRYDCFKLIGEVVLYDIVEDRNKIFLISFFNFFKFDVFLKLLDLCFDENGYNFFYRLVIGGNV